MDSRQFAVITHGKDAERAFETAVEESRWEYGHGGFTGRIGEKTSFTVLRDGKPLSFFEAAEAMAAEHHDPDSPANDRDGAALAYQLKGGGPDEEVWFFFGTAPY